MYRGLKVKYLLLLPDLMKPELSSKILKKSADIKFYQNTSTRYQVVPRRQTDITKLTAALHNFANAPKGGS
jgi:hypothetical protein